MIQKLIGIKSSLNEEQLKNKLNLFPLPPLLEIFLTTQDYECEAYIEKRINSINQEFPSLKLMLHAPVDSNKKDTIHLQDSDFEFYYSKLYFLCKKYSFILGFVAHPEPKTPKQSSKLILENNIAFLKQKYPSIEKFMYIENLTNSITLKFNTYLEFIEKNNIENVCFDFAHFVSNHTNNNQLQEALNQLNNSNIIKNIYLHISDNIFNNNSPIPLNIGRGEVNFKNINPYLNFGILETISKNEELGEEIKEDYNKIIQL
ncbi:MAG: sugar phosphate isomerase/epimerase [Nanoarchaeota archaeon]|nr:sugar phosphate isomerase/epimerase [Nanoarchaeota archaeon]